MLQPDTIIYRGTTVAVHPPTPALEKQDDDPELTIILAEYGHQYDRRRAALDGVNQTLTLYLGALGFVVPLVGAVAVFSQDPKINPYIIAGFMTFSCVATISALLRSYKQRIEQTYAEQSMSRLRRYFVDRFPHLRTYLPGPFYDDWPTPFTHRWHSLTFYGWMTFCVAAGAFAGFAVAAIMWGLPYIYDFWFAVSVPLSIAFAVFGATFTWVWKRLNYEREAFESRFPLQKKADLDSG